MTNDEINERRKNLEKRRLALEAKKAEIEKEAKAIQEEELANWRSEALKRWEIVFAHKEALIALVEHDRTSCSDTNIANGWGSAEYGARCAKCAMLEILNGERSSENFDIEVNVNIRRIE